MADEHDRHAAAMPGEQAARLALERADLRRVGAGDLAQLCIEQRMAESEGGRVAAAAHRRADHERLDRARREHLAELARAGLPGGREPRLALAAAGFVPDQRLAAG